MSLRGVEGEEERPSLFFCDPALKSDPAAKQCQISQQQCEVPQSSRTGEYGPCTPEARDAGCPG